MVLNYAFHKQPPAIWFEQPNENDSLCFSPKHPGDKGLEGIVLVTEALQDNG